MRVIRKKQGPNLLERPLEELAGVLDVDRKLAHEDEVEVGGVEPFGLDVIDLEVDVRHAAGLNTGEVDADDMGVGKPLGHLDGPGPRAAAEF